MIEVKGLSKFYGDRKAIENLNFSVSQGKIVGLLGPNGAGKTTTMKIITGFMAASQGSARVGGFDVADNPIQVKSQIGYLPEVPPVYFDMTVLEYLRFVAGLKKVEKQNIQAYVDQSLDSADLQSVKNRRIENLSKGFKQRVGIAQALVSQPKLLILDEPTVGLDPKQVLEIRELIKSLKGKHTVILSTHILSEVQATCDEVIIINEGKILTQSPIEELTRVNGGDRFIEITVRSICGDIVGKLKAVPGVKSVLVDGNSIKVALPFEDKLIESISRLVVESGSGLLEYKKQHKNLEDIFIHLIDVEKEASNEVDTSNS